MNSLSDVAFAFRGILVKCSRFPDPVSWFIFRSTAISGNKLQKARNLELNSLAAISRSRYLSRSTVFTYRCFDLNFWRKARTFQTLKTLTGSRSRPEHFCHNRPNTWYLSQPGRNSWLDSLRQSSLQILSKREIGTSTENSGERMSVPRTDSQKCPYVVGHDQAQNMFYIKLSAQDKDCKDQEPMAKLEYARVQSGLVDLYHTEVPPAFQGKGIAKVLVLAGLDYFCEQDVLIRPTCTYVQKVLKENLTSTYKDHVEKAFLSSL